MQLLKPLSTVNIHRYVGPINSATACQLHIFCDALKDSYGAAVYLRAAQPEAVAVNLLYSKMHLALTGTLKGRQDGKLSKPPLTLPRLELLAAVVGMRASNFVMKEVKVPISERILWTDSKCVLLWLQSQARLAVFIENRIKELRRESEVQFRHVQSEENPADQVTHGLTPTEIADSDQWWHGPHWLNLFPFDKMANFLSKTCKATSRLHNSQMADNLYGHDIFSGS